MQELEAGREAGAQAHSRNKAGGEGGGSPGYQDRAPSLPLPEVSSAQGLRMGEIPFSSCPIVCLLGKPGYGIIVGAQPG